MKNKESKEVCNSHLHKLLQQSNCWLLLRRKLGKLMWQGLPPLDLADADHASWQISYDFIWFHDCFRQYQFCIQVWWTLMNIDVKWICLKDIFKASWIFAASKWNVQIIQQTHWEVLWYLALANKCNGKSPPTAAHFMLASEEHRKSIGACEVAELGNAVLEAAQGGTLVWIPCNPMTLANKNKEKNNLLSIS